MPTCTSRVTYGSMAAEAPSLKAASLLTDRSGVGARSGRPAGRGRQRAHSHSHARGWQSRKSPTHPVPVQKLHQRRRQSSPGQYGRHVTSCVHVPVCVPNRMHLPRLYSAAGLPPGPGPGRPTRQLPTLPRDELTYTYAPCLATPPRTCRRIRMATHPAWVSLSVQARAYVNIVLPIQLRAACMRRTTREQSYMRAHRPPNRNTPTPHAKRNRNKTIRPACT
jgi:hypothetical protein